MRLAIVSDIHGNLTALEAVAADIARRGVDRVVHGGDLVLIGARPAEVFDRVGELGWEGIVGNTDELLWRPEELQTQLEAAPKLGALLRMLFEQYAPATAELLGQARLDALAELPATCRIGKVCLVHASPGNLWRAPMPSASDDDLVSTYRGLGSAAVVYGHVHWPFVRNLSELTVANAGSVGIPWDGDPRASYLFIDDGEPDLIRVEYDIEAEVKALQASGYPDSARIAAMLRSGRFTPVGGT
jgi:putative phosphoesterase